MAIRRGPAPGLDPEARRHAGGAESSGGVESCQDLADSARYAGVELIRYESVRDPHAGRNLAVLACKAFSEASPIERKTWRIRFGGAGVQAICEFPYQGLEFTLDTFSDPRLASLRLRA